MEFRILGPLEVLDDGVPIELGAPKQRSVLAVLLLHADEVVSADRLVDLVWGEDPPRTAAHSVQIYVSELRKSFEGNGDVIVTRRPGYVLRADPDTIDARRFAQLVGEASAAWRDGDRGAAKGAARLALALWRGAPLADFAYEEFAQREIDRLNQLHHQAVSVASEVNLASGEPLEAVPMLCDAVTRDPLREDTRRLLMLALYSGGRQAEALREFRDYRQVLAEETGLDPSPELLRLEEQILLRDPSVAPATERPHPKRAVERNPYKGLRAFGEADAADFFGRESLVRHLLAVSASPLTAVVGPSGSGKSSVVRAGLIPALRSGGRDAPDGWTIATLIPGRYPFAEFDAALSRTMGAATADSDPSDDSSIARSVLRCLPTEAGIMLLVIDQFEELFTLTDEPTRRAFLRNLVTAIDDARGRIRVLLTVRADFYDRPLLYPEFAALFTENVVNVMPLTPAEIEAAAVGPAQHVGVGLAPDLLAQLVSDMTNQPGALPLFQYTLTELFEERGDSTMTLEGYRRIGGLSGALSRRADAVYGSLEPDEREIARGVFLHLVKPTEDRFTRRPVPALDLESVGDAVLVSTVLSRFGEERLLTFGRDSQTGAATVEVSHEALLTGWDRLSGWLDEARVDVAQLDGLMASAVEWEGADRDPGYLLSGARLTDYEAWRDATTMTLPTSVASYLMQSVEAKRAADGAEAERAAREAKATKRARVRLWGMLAAVVTLVAVVTFAVLVSIANRPPTVAFLFDGDESGGWGGQMLAGVDLAEAEYGLDVAVKTSSEFGVPYELTSVIESGPSLVINGMASSMAGEAGDIEIAHPEIHFVHPDVGQRLDRSEIEANPHISFPIFPVHEGSFLVGIAAARMTGTGVVGFIGGVDSPLIREFEGGFAAGVDYVARESGTEIEVLVDYLTPWPWYDSGGFFVPSLAFEVATEMHAANADVIFTAAGGSGFGAVVAARMSSLETGIHRWHIGVDSDEFKAYEALGDEHLGPIKAADALPHILTSMEKRVGVAVYDALGDYQNGVFISGIREYGLAEDGVGYATSGGHVDSLIPELERLKQLIVDGEIEVPHYPAGYQVPEFDEEP